MSISQTGRGSDSTPPIRLLVIEDNVGDVRLIQEMIREGGWTVVTAVARDGAEALRYLRQVGEFSLTPRPDLVLLDLNLPQLDGREVLAEVRSDPRLNSIPTVIFTSSPAHEDVLLAQTFHADGYLRKPIRVAEFAALLARLDIVAPGRGPPTPEPDSHAATATSGSSLMENDGQRA